MSASEQRTYGEGQNLRYYGAPNLPEKCFSLEMLRNDLTIQPHGQPPDASRLTTKLDFKHNLSGQ